MHSSCVGAGRVRPCKIPVSVQRSAALELATARARTGDCTAYDVQGIAGSIQGSRAVQKGRGPLIPLLALASLVSLITWRLRESGASDVHL